MPKWICDDCGCHFPSGVSDCPKCNTGKTIFKMPVISQTVEQWLNLHGGHEFRSIKSSDAERVLLKCKKCNEYYLL